MGQWTTIDTLPDLPSDSEDEDDVAISDRTVTSPRRTLEAVTCLSLTDCQSPSMALSTGAPTSRLCSWLGANCIGQARHVWWGS